MIDIEFLSQCTDEQINSGVAWAKLSSLSLKDYEKRSSTAMFKWYGPSRGYQSYCMSPNHAWPIIDSNGITVGPVFTSSDRIKIATCKDFWIRDANGLRAAMIVYILMMVAK
tara:strand:- start:132 stop:467 length:336 start_codon:yes stop_codon:yes gene_type:complete